MPLVYPSFNVVSQGGRDGMGRARSGGAPGLRRPQAFSRSSRIGFDAGFGAKSGSPLRSFEAM